MDYRKKYRKYKDKYMILKRGSTDNDMEAKGHIESLLEEFEKIPAQVKARDEERERKLPGSNVWRIEGLTDEEYAHSEEQDDSHGLQDEIYRTFITYLAKGKIKDVDGPIIASEILKRVVPYDKDRYYW